ncbi:MAG: GumC family protein [Prochlorococcus marinus subsp. pastoris]
MTNIINHMENSKITNADSVGNDNEILNLSLILKLFLRNKKLISSFSIVFFIIGCLFALSLKRTWEGQFQIVVESKNKNFGDPLLGRLQGIGRNGDLLTEVEILKSPSVLMPVFEFYKSNSDEFSDKEESFSGWQKNLDIELEKGTSVLNISYRDKNKSKIIPILEKVSFSYQDYSGRAKRRNLELNKQFLNTQIELFKNKSSDSLRYLQEFGIKNDLVYQSSNEIGLDENFRFEQSFNEDDLIQKRMQNIQVIKPSLLPNVGIENIRIQWANRIKAIELQVTKIKKLSDAGDLQYIGSTIPALKREGLPQTLKKIEEELVDLRSKYNNEDITIIRLLDKRKLTIELLKERAIKYLEAEKLEAESKMESVMRPQGVLLKYKELLRNAARDENTLINLEDQLRKQRLQEATLEDPWELITKPTLLSSPVAPSRKRIGLLSLIFGLLCGIFLSLYKEKKSDKIYSIEEIKKLLPIKIISEINVNEIDSETQKLSFIKDYIYKNSKGDLYFINGESIESNDLESLKKALYKVEFQKNINFSSDKEFFDKIKNEDSIYLLVKIGSVKYQDIIMLRKRQAFLEINFDGIIILY